MSSSATNAVGCPFTLLREGVSASGTSGRFAMTANDFLQRYAQGISVAQIEQITQPIAVASAGSRNQPQPERVVAIEKQIAAANLVPVAQYFVDFARRQHGAKTGYITPDPRPH